MLGLLRPIIPFGTPSIFWTKTLYHLPAAIGEEPAEESNEAPRLALLKSINRAMQSLRAGDAGLGGDIEFQPGELELGETRVFKTNFPFDPTKLEPASAYPPLPLNMITQISISLDFTQWTFIIDLGKDEHTNRRYTRFGPMDNQPAPDDWRTALLQRLHQVSSAYESALLDTPLDEVKLAARDKDTRLLMDIFFVQIWDQFRKTYHDVDKVLSGGTKIHEAKGLALSTRGLHAGDTRSIAPLTDDEARTASRVMLASFRRFMGHGGEKIDEPNEAHATLSAFWPMVKTMTPDINNRQYVACGVLGFKALLISALGSPTRARTSSSGDDDLANRVLFITKAEPEPTQLARMVDRLMSLEVYAAYSLWNHEILGQADRNIMSRSNDLDRHIRQWIRDQAGILGAAQTRYENASRRASRSFWYGKHYRGFLDEHRNGRWIDDEPSYLSPRKKRAYRRFVDIELYRIDDARDAEMAAVSGVMNDTLANLARDINEVGGAATNVPFMVDRARLFTEYFNAILPTFQGGNIDTWLSYDSFGRRGRMPRQNAIDRTGIRIGTLNRRLQAITELIQTSALIQQANATRSNTAKIRAVIWAAVFFGSFLYVLIRIGTALPEWRDWILKLMPTFPAG